MANPTLDGNDMGNVQIEGGKKIANMTELPLPLSDSDATEVFDFGGSVRTFTVPTLQTGATVGALKTILDTFLALLNGDQSSTVAYVSDLSGTINVKVRSIDYAFTAGSPNILELNFVLIQASGLG